MKVRCGWGALGLFFLAWIGALGGCGRTPDVFRPDSVVSLLPKGPHSNALISLRRYLPSVVTCPATIELTKSGVSWVDIHSCHPTDLRRRLHFKDIQAARLIHQKVSLGSDQRWVEVLHKRAWIPIGRGVDGLRGKGGIWVLEGVKTALERLGTGRKTTHYWKHRARPYLF